MPFCKKCYLNGGLMANALKCVKKESRCLIIRLLFFPVTFNARKCSALSHIVIILRRGLTALKINRAQIRQNKKSSLPQMKHYAKGNQLVSW